MKHNTLNKLAETIDNAAKTAEVVAQLSETDPINLEEAYEIQKLSNLLRLERGESHTGYKLGFTSKAKMEQMGVHDVIWGRLTNIMDIPNGGTLDLSRFIHPRVEPEIAFKISKDIDTVLTLNNVKEYVEAVAPAIEVIDSRYKNFKFSLEDVIADNCSSSAYVLGRWFSTDQAVNHLGIQLLINDQVVQEGNSSAILGDPWESMIEASKMAQKYYFKIQKGEVILAGAATSAEFVKSGDEVVASFEQLGKVHLKIK